MTAWLRAILAALPLPHVTVVFGDYVEHQGDTNHGPDDDCDHGPFDPDEPIGTARVMDDDELYAFASIAGREAIASDDVERGAREAMAQLALEEAAYRIEDGT